MKTREPRASQPRNAVRPQTGMVRITRRLCRAVEDLRFSPPIHRVYNPLRYARAPFELYLRRYGAAPRHTIFLGMNPGPFGMAQTGVPFGEVDSVRGWLGIEAPVRRPADEHPKRPVLGFDCSRREVSGRRFWGFLERRFGTPERFFRCCFVANYCPLLFLEQSGRNCTPDRIPVDERAPLFEVCDEALRQTVRCLGARRVIGIGRFAETRARSALAGLDVSFALLPHPSPANPAANRGWERLAAETFDALGVRP